MNPVSRLAARGIALALAIVVLVAPAAAASAADDAAPVFVTSAIGPSAVGAYYSQQVAVEGETATFRLASGAPSGMAITTGGFFEWVPAASGSFEFAIVASTDAGETVQPYTFVVTEATGLVPQQPQAPSPGQGGVPASGDQVTAFAPDMQLPTLSEPGSSAQTVRSASAPELDPAIMTGSSGLVLLLLVGIMLLLRRQLAKA